MDAAIALLEVRSPSQRECAPPASAAREANRVAHRNAAQAHDFDAVSLLGRGGFGFVYGARCRRRCDRRGAAR